MRTDDIRNAVRYLDKLLDGEELTLEEAMNKERELTMAKAMEEHRLTGLTGTLSKKGGEEIKDKQREAGSGKREDVLDGAHDRRKDPLFQDKIGFIPFAYHLVPPRGLAKVSSVMRKGEREGRGNNWKEVSVEEHLNHAISHIVAYFAGQEGKHNLANAGCRILMALDLDNSERLPFVPVSPLPVGS